MLYIVKDASDPSINLHCPVLACKWTPRTLLGLAKHVTAEHIQDQDGQMSSNTVVTPMETTAPVASPAGSFWCSLCDKSFSSKRSLKRHQANVHKLQPDQDGQMPSNSVEVTPMETTAPDAAPAGSFWCSLCEKPLSSKRNLKRHQVNVHKLQLDQDGQIVHPEQLEQQEELQMDSSEEGLYQDQGNTSPPSISYSDSASASQSAVHTCSICEKSYSSRRSLMRHMLAAHPDGVESMPFKCNLCRVQFAQLTSLEIHAEKAHKNSIRCMHCPSWFTAEKSRREHTRKKHSDIKY